MAQVVLAQKYDMRAVWMATVANIDWPSQPNLSESEQKAELISLLDEYEKDKINAVAFQIRPSSDAFYFSNLESSSIWLNGQDCPNYDVLDFFINEAHSRAMEVHAWINPYRVTTSLDTLSLPHDHVFYTKRHLVRKYFLRYYLDPGCAETREYLNSVIKEIVSRYDIDAVHFDDYFYPYRVAGLEFPDEDTFINNNPDSIASKDDWRRNNVNLVVKELRETIKSIKPWVQFGISPFGVWRNIANDERGSNTRAGQTNYDDLYADGLKWIDEETVDYVVPQLYWEIGKEVADYKILIDWWNKLFENKNVNYYVGLYASGLEVNKAKAWRSGNEIIRQMNMYKDYDNIQGTFFYSSSRYLKNLAGLRDSLNTRFYKYHALVPPQKGVTKKNEFAPFDLSIAETDSTYVLDWKCNTPKDSIFCYVVYALDNQSSDTIDISNNVNIIAKTTKTTFVIDKSTILSEDTHFVVTMVNRYRVESLPSDAVLTPKKEEIPNVIEEEDEQFF